MSRRNRKMTRRLLYIPDDTWLRLDRVAGKDGKSEFIREAIEEKLQKERSL